MLLYEYDGCVAYKHFGLPSLPQTLNWLVVIILSQRLVYFFKPQNKNSLSNLEKLTTHRSFVLLSGSQTYQVHTYMYIVGTRGKKILVRNSYMKLTAFNIL